MKAIDNPANFRVEPTAQRSYESSFPMCRNLLEQRNKVAVAGDYKNDVDMVSQSVPQNVDRYRDINVPTPGLLLRLMKHAWNDVVFPAFSGLVSSARFPLKRNYLISHRINGGLITWDACIIVDPKKVQAVAVFSKIRVPH